MVSVAVVEDLQVLGEISVHARQGHMERLLPVIDQIMTGTGMTLQELDAIAVAIGPGSFTSLRVGLATAQALAHALGKPLTGVPTLDALAASGCLASGCGRGAATGLICPLLTARAQEVYACFYISTDQGIKRLSGYLALDPQRLADRLRQELRSGITFTGEGALKYWDLLRAALGERARLAGAAHLWPRGAQIAAIGLTQLDRQEARGRQVVRPLYVKPPAIRHNKDG